MDHTSYIASETAIKFYNDIGGMVGAFDYSGLTKSYPSHDRVSDPYIKIFAAAHPKSLNQTQACIALCPVHRCCFFLLFFSRSSVNSL